MNVERQFNSFCGETAVDRQASDSKSQREPATLRVGDNPVSPPYDVRLLANSLCRIS
jgi:hypothetical protein